MSVLSTPMPGTSFKQPAIRGGEWVKVSARPDFHHPVICLVSEVKTNSISAIGFSSAGVVFFDDAWHRSDPRVETHQELILEDRARGVWDFAEVTLEQQAIRRYLDDLEGRKLPALEQELRQLREQIGKAAPAGSHGDNGAMAQRVDEVAAALAQHDKQIRALHEAQTSKRRSRTS